ncbi:MAG: hypothetical protein HYT39_04015 [Candidatus Sungbacteria bacterium]|nr:hypothetical protein [Candidatus Sungbacteria bacterium]
MNFRTIILTILILAVLGGGYLWWSGRSQSAKPSMETAFTKEIDAKLQEFRKIQSISPNLNIFDDALLLALRASGIIVQIPGGTGTSTGSKGRANPFVAF